MNQELETLIMNAGDLPTIPAVATRVMQLIENESTTSDELSRIVSSDPAVAARVLKISNSSFYGCQRKIQTLSHAIMMLGFSTLKSLVVAAAVKQVYKPYGLTEQMLWEHSFGAGLAARIIAGTSRVAREEEAFLGGLFHDIGKIVMNIMDRRKFQGVMQKCYNERISFLEAEQQAYSFNHAEAGALVIKKWNFPERLMFAVMKHHTCDFDAAEDAYRIQLASVVSLSNLFCHKAGVGMRDREDIALHETAPAIILDIREEQMNDLFATFEEAFNGNKDFFI